MPSDGPRNLLAVCESHEVGRLAAADERMMEAAAALGMEVDAF
ncbi:MAG: hypothetical protein ACOC5E_00750 [Acidobacteriota bacterium]